MGQINSTGGRVPALHTINRLHFWHLIQSQVPPGVICEHRSRSSPEFCQVWPQTEKVKDFVVGIILNCSPDHKVVYEGGVHRMIRDNHVAMKCYIAGNNVRDGGHYLWNAG